MPTEHVVARLESEAFSCAGTQIHELVGREAISRLFAFEVTLIAIDPSDFDADRALGAEVDVVFELSGVETRRVHGMVAAITDELDSEPAHRTYRLSIRPRAHRLAMVETQEVFLGLSVPDIVKQKLALVDLGATDVEARLSDTYPARDFVVEYKETDVAFVSRLTEHLGVSFFFEARDGKDVLVLGDSPSAFRPAPGAERLPFRPRGEATGVFALEKKREIMPAMWVVQDYNYRLPRVDLTSTDEVPGAYAGGVVEYGAHVKTPAESAALAKARAEEREAACRYFVGASDRTELAAGATFVLEGHPRLPGDQALLVVEVEHRLVQVVGTFGGRQAEHYKNTFRAVDASTRYRPPRTTPRPKIHGVVTALVEPKADGTLGSVADIDDWGRYTIRFYFDTSPLGERQKSSHAVRMIQQHAGPNYGTHLPLKAGIEVLVVFVDGDPDRPLVVGAVHNPVTPNPVVSADPHKHRVKTASGILIEMRDAFARG